MSGRTKVIIGNWKMNFTIRQAVSFASKLAQKTIPEGITIVVAPPTLALSEVAQKLDRTGIKVAAQNAYFQDEGAFTGEISMPMLRGVAKYVIIGHSERRTIFHENNKDIAQKVSSATRSGITPILCIGETLLEHRSGYTNQILNDQLTLGLTNLTSEEVAKTVIAYEPVWAIGTGEFAKPEQVEPAVKNIRSNIASLYGLKTAQAVRILYGGSVSKENAMAYLSVADVDGLLIGGASLNATAFWDIAQKAGQIVPKKIKVKA